MRIADALAESALEPIDAELLAGHACGKDRTWIVAHSLDAIESDQLSAFHSLVKRRKRGEPVAYIIGTKEFFGRTFYVSPATLIPRPSTELLVQTALDVMDGKPVDRLRTIDEQIVAWTEVRDPADIQLVIDIGTGSGCIAITIALERPDICLIATDISVDALDTARKNADALHVSDRIIFRQGNGLAAAEPIDEPFLVVSNPPYIPDQIVLERDVADFEPSSALFAGKEGTDVLHPLIADARSHPLYRGFVIECREEQVK
jgi:release factor glutamine methyltransferase